MVLMQVMLARMGWSQQILRIYDSVAADIEFLGGREELLMSVITLAKHGITPSHTHPARPDAIEASGSPPRLRPHCPEHQRFIPLSDPYSPALRRLKFPAAHHLKLEPSALAEGTYAWVSGPTYETPQRTTLFAFSSLIGRRMEAGGETTS
ncbi:hypothetical protein B0H15DRAFT_955510 [Mycena belliarum]|uniref:Uncharacterized protein n=1 Tax=Mycena belliarum TaxID=1033014 RepID=A0AAD6XK38_9AGAR|nr:hypothetical protein B0H15DRAFT_955510 [Mycena belliae]